MLNDKEYNKLKGSLLLERIHLYAGHKMCIDVERLGHAINTRHQVVITLELVDGKKSWVLREATNDVIKKARGHGYLINGENYERIGGNPAKASRPQLQNAKPLKRKHVELVKHEAEVALKRTQFSSSDFSGENILLNKERRKIKEKRKLLEKVDKGILPKAKIIYTPMGNDRRRK